MKQSVLTNDVKHPLVSIIIPAYNAERYVKEALDSALAQTYPNCEVIVVDDGSTDRTRTILESYMAEGKIRYIYQKNKGLAGARNVGIRAARGEYIALLDSDDILLPDKVREQVEALESHPSYGVCYCDILHFTDPPAGRAGTAPRVFYHHRYNYPSGNILEPLLSVQFINPLTIVARAEVFERYGYFDEQLRRSEDWDLWLRWAYAGVEFFHLHKPLAHYRIRGGGNLSSVESEPEMKEKNFEVFSRLAATMSEEERKHYQMPLILSRLKRKAALAHLMVGDKKGALARDESMPLILKMLIVLLPSFLWKTISLAMRSAKHRSLLERLPAGTIQTS